MKRRPHIHWIVPLQASYSAHLHAPQGAMFIGRDHCRIRVQILNAVGGFQVRYLWTSEFPMPQGYKLPTVRVGFTSKSYAKTCAQIRSDIRRHLGWLGE